VVDTGYLQKDHSTRLNTTLKRHLQQTIAVMKMKSIWTSEPNEKQREQRDFVLRHVLYQNRPCLLAEYVLWTFCDDTQKREFYVPFDLLRVGDLSNSMNTTQLTSGIGARTRSRCAVDVIGGGSAGQLLLCIRGGGQQGNKEGHLAPLQARP
jgi:hypothetical protein